MNGLCRRAVPSTIGAHGHGESFLERGLCVVYVSESALRDCMMERSARPYNQGGKGIEPAFKYQVAYCLVSRLAEAEVQQCARDAKMDGDIIRSDPFCRILRYELQRAFDNKSGGGRRSCRFAFDDSPYRAAADRPGRLAFAVRHHFQQEIHGHASFVLRVELDAGNLRGCG